MFIRDIENEVINDLKKGRFDKWFERAREKQSDLATYENLNALLDDFKNPDAKYSETHNSVLLALISELQSRPEETPWKLIIYIFIPLLVRLAEGRKSTDPRTPEDVHTSVVFHFLEVVNEFPLDRLGTRIFGNIRHRLENRLRKEWIEETTGLNHVEYTEFLDGDPFQKQQPDVEEYENKDYVAWLLNELRDSQHISDEDLRIIVKHDVHGISLSVIAKEGNVPVERLKKRRQRALTVLRAYFHNVF